MIQRRKTAAKVENPSGPSDGETAVKAAKTTATTATTAAESDANSKKKSSLRNLWTRTWATFLMIGGFVAVIYVGHWACFFLVVACQIAMFKELENVRVRGQRTSTVQLVSQVSNWSFYVAFAWGVTGRVLAITFGEQWLRFGLPGLLLVRYHTLVTFVMYCVAFIAFVLTLRRGHFKEQFKAFAWTHMILLVVTLQVNLWEHTLFKGLYWFVLPASLVIANDIFAFVFGKLFGRHRLIALSPNKTWEGFLGGMFSSFVLCFFLSSTLSRWSWLTCPKTNLFTWGVDCVPDPIFQPTAYTVPLWLPSWLGGGSTFEARPVQFHSLVFALFASIVAPFGGFFASGLKRAFGAKDFDSVIPGHGGVTDRMDCQFLMGTFVNLYHYTFFERPSVADVMKSIVFLDREAQMEVFTRLAAMLNVTNPF